MYASQEVRDKLVLVIGNLICRCIDEARKVPYILDQDEVIQILVENPRLFERLVRDEQLDRTEFSREKLTAKLDTLKELGQFEALDTWDMSFSGRIESDADLSPIVEQVSQLSRTFAVYVNNTMTIFEREFALFMEKFRHSLRLVGMTIQTMELTPEDMVGLTAKARPYLNAGQFLQAFSFDRLLNCDVINKDVFIVPCSGYLVSRELMQSSLRDPGLFRSLTKFILRLTYISQGAWHEFFDILVSLVDRQAETYQWKLFVDLIQEDVIFVCNLLREPFAEIQLWTPERRRAAIEGRLASESLKAGRA